MNKENKQLFSRQAIKAVGLSAVKRPQMRDCPYCHEKVATAQFGSHVELCVEAQEAHDDSNGDQDEEVAINEILAGVVAFVDVRTANAAMCSGLSAKLEQMGAQVTPTLGQAVTHLIFKEGHRKNIEKANKKGLAVVNVLWPQECFEAKARLPEADYAVVLDDDSATPSRSRKSMEPVPRDSPFAAAGGESSASSISVTTGIQPPRAPAARSSLSKQPAKSETTSRPVVAAAKPATSMDVDEEYNSDASEELIDADCPPRHEGEEDDEASCVEETMLDDYSVASMELEPVSGRVHSSARVHSSIDTLHRTEEPVMQHTAESDMAPVLSRRRSGAARTRLIHDSDDEMEVVGVQQKVAVAVAAKASGEQRAGRLDRARRIQDTDDEEVEEEAQDTRKASKKMIAAKSRRVVESNDEGDESGEGEQSVRAPVKKGALKQADPMDEDENIVAAPGKKASAQRDGARKESHKSVVEKAPKKASMKKEKSQVGDVKATKKQATAVETKSAKKAGKTSDKRKRAVVDSEEEDEEDEITENPIVKPSASTSKGSGKSSKGSGKSAAAASDTETTESKGSRKKARTSLGQERSFVRTPQAAVRGVIVLTNIRPQDKDMIVQAIEFLKGYQIADKITSRTTHLVCGEARRTLSLVCAIAHGCWVVSPEWILKSLSESEWVSEETYELFDDYPAARITRLEKSMWREDAESTAGRSPDLKKFRHNLLDNKPIYVAENVDGIPPPLITSCIIACGGRPVQKWSQAELCIGRCAHKKSDEPPCVKATWLLDAIQNYDMPASLDQYMYTQSAGARADSPCY